LKRCHHQGNQVGIFVSALHSTELIRGLTHDFYRYPARFSPAFARAAIELFTEPGDLILDPFAGGGTSLVEARVLGRPAVGVDLSPLATFISKVKTSVLTPDELAGAKRWNRLVLRRLHLWRKGPKANGWASDGYHRNINDRSTWPIRKSIELALQSASLLEQPRLERFIRCAVLRTGQWALDGRDRIPTASEFRTALTQNLQSMIQGAAAFAKAARMADRSSPTVGFRRTLSVQADAGEISDLNCFENRPAPKLVLTSPPYPGIHVLYNRWQVLGRRESPAPFWIADEPSDVGAADLTFGDRRIHAESRYFKEVERAFASVSEVLDRTSIVVQLVAFSQPTKQLPLYLDAVSNAGFREVYLSGTNGTRHWRGVPNRKWYADQWGINGSRKEVLLFHKLR